MIMKSVVKGLSRFEARRLQRQIDRRNARKKIVANDNIRSPELCSPVPDPVEPQPVEAPPPAALMVPKRRAIKRTAQNAHAPDWALEYDAYYTKPHVAEFIAKVMRTFVATDTMFVEPSAGGGAILDQFPGAVGIDIHPTRDDIIEADFLADDLPETIGLTADQQSRLCIVGNPPYGAKSSMAVAFLNKALNIADTVGFILPIPFGYHEVQQHVDPRARLVVDIELPRASFTLAGRGYGVWARFQIWTKRAVKPGDYTYQGTAEWKGRGKMARLDRARVTCRMGSDLRRPEPDVLECDDFAVIRRKAQKAPRFSMAIPVARSKEYETNITTDPTKIVPTYEYWFVVAKAVTDIGKLVARLLKIPFQKFALRHCHRGQRFVMFDAIREYRRLKLEEEKAPPYLDQPFTIPSARAFEPYVVSNDAFALDKSSKLAA